MEVFYRLSGLISPSFFVVAVGGRLGSLHCSCSFFSSFPLLLPSQPSREPQEGEGEKEA